MPNWCYTNVCFKGKPENIQKLREHISLANEFGHNNPSWCNIRYFLSLSNFDTISYNQRYKNYYDCNFRGNIYETTLKEEEDGDYLLYCPFFEMAWDMDYTILQIISLIYGVTFSAYSEEPGMDIHTRCSNDNTIKYNDYDYIICADSEQLEEVIDENPELDIDYSIPVEKYDDIENVAKQYTDYGIEYNIGAVDYVLPPIPYGVYYHFINGVVFDDDLHKRLYRYPELDPFNIYINQ